MSPSSNAVYNMSFMPCYKLLMHLKGSPAALLSFTATRAHDTILLLMPFAHTKHAAKPSIPARPTPFSWNHMGCGKVQQCPLCHVLLTSSFSRQCNATCGDGGQSRRVACVASGMRPVQDDYCDPASQPQAWQPCTAEPCPYTWITGEWSQVEQKWMWNKTVKLRDPVQPFHVTEFFTYFLWFTELRNNYKLLKVLITHMFCISKVT